MVWRTPLGPMLTFKPGGPTPKLTPDLLKFRRKNFPREIDLRNRRPISWTLLQKYGDFVSLTHLTQVVVAYCNERHSAMFETWPLQDLHGPEKLCAPSRPHLCVLNTQKLGFGLEKSIASTVDWCGFLHQVTTVYWTVSNKTPKMKKPRYQ